MAQEWDLAKWQDRLATLLDEREALEGAPNFSIAGMNTDQQSSYQQLLSGIAEARRQIISLGGSSTGVANRRNVSVTDSLY